MINWVLHDGFCDSHNLLELNLFKRSCTTENVKKELTLLKDSHFQNHCNPDSTHHFVDHGYGDVDVALDGLEARSEPHDRLEHLLDVRGNLLVLFRTKS